VPLGVDAQQPTVTQTPPARQAPELARHALNGALEGFEVVLLELNNQPSQLGRAPSTRAGVPRAPTRAPAPSCSWWCRRVAPSSRPPRSERS
jgi:hypothetical protein